MTSQQLLNEIVWFTIDEMEKATQIEKTIKKLDRDTIKLQRLMNEISNYIDQ